MMHSPSPQLLRALRASIETSTALRHRCRSSTSFLQFPTTPLALSSCRHSSSSSNRGHVVRPTRLIPRAHKPKPATHDRGPESTEDTQTDFAALNVLGSIATPATAIDACLDDGFHLDSGAKVTGGDGVLLVGGESFAWRPWEASASRSTSASELPEDPMKAQATMLNEKGQFEIDERAWGLLGLVWPRPDLLIIGLGASMLPLSPVTKRHINSLGIRVEVQDTRNAAAQFNLLATERGVSEVAAALIPIGWNRK